jgi:hypothetical protein
MCKTFSNLDKRLTMSAKIRMVLQVFCCLRVMSAVSFVCGNTLSVWKTTTAIFYAASVSIAYLAFFRNSRSHILAIICATFFALEPHLLRWSATGMENSLVALAISCALLFHVIGERSGASNVTLGVILGILPGIRPEWLIFSGIYVCLTFYFRRDIAIQISVGAAAGLLAIVLLPLLLTGFALPQTASAKAIFLVQPLSLHGLSPIPLIIASGSSISALVILFSLGISKRLDHWCFATLGFVTDRPRRVPPYYQTISKCTIMRHILGMAFGRMIGFSPGCSAIGALMSGPWP